MSMGRGHHALVLVVALVGGTPAGALAQTTSEQTARLHFQTGASYYETGNYAEALREFERSYEISRRPELFYNYSRCYEHLGDLASAALHLRRYLEEAPEVANREALEIRLRNLEQRQATPGARQAGPVDGAPPPRDGAPPPRAGGEAPAGAIVAFGLAGAALIAGAITGGLVISEHSALSSMCGALRSCDDGQLSMMRTLAVVTDISFGVSLGAAALGLVLALVAGSSGEQAAPVAVLPYVGVDGADGGGVLGGVLVGGAL